MKKRVTVLFDSAEQLANHWDRNDTHMVIDSKATAGFDLHVRYQCDEFSQLGPQNSKLYGHTNGSNFTSRITWQPNKSHLNQSILDGWKQYGFNLYTDNLAITSINGFHFIKTIKYNLLHLDALKENQIITDFMKLPAEISRFVHWNLEECSYDILASASSLEIDEICHIDANNTFTIAQLDDETLEVGLFYVDSVDIEDINLSGLRCKWNENTHILESSLKTSLFYKAAIKWNTNLQSFIDLEEPSGLHPRIRVDLRSVISEGDSSCEYYLYTQLPLQLYLDAFQQMSIFAFGEQDLELPTYKLMEKSWGSEALFHLDTGMINEIVLHSRYAKPCSESAYDSAVFLSTVFKACDGKAQDMVRNPFYKKSLGLDSFFTDDTVFDILERKELVVTIPRPNQAHFNIIEKISFIAILLAILYLAQMTVFTFCKSQKNREPLKDLKKDR